MCIRDSPGGDPIASLDEAYRAVSMSDDGTDRATEVGAVMVDAQDHQINGRGGADECGDRVTQQHVGFDRHARMLRAERGEEVLQSCPRNGHEFRALDAKRLRHDMEDAETGFPDRRLSQSPLECSLVHGPGAHSDCHAMERSGPLRSRCLLYTSRCV